jgi:hypothetical protein
MTGYTFDDHDVDPAALEQARRLRERWAPLAEGTPQWRYLTETRKLPAAAVRRCVTDLRALEPPIPHFGSVARGIVSIIRDAAGEEIGFAVEACGIAGEAVKRNGRTLRRHFNLGAAKLSTGLFRAAADNPTDMAVMVEGHLAKAIAAAAVYPDRNVYGWGSRSWLGRSVPPEREILIIEDREPADDE